MADIFKDILDWLNFSIRPRHDTASINWTQWQRTFQYDKKWNSSSLSRKHFALLLLQNIQHSIHCYLVFAAVKDQLYICVVNEGKNENDRHSNRVDFEFLTRQAKMDSFQAVTMPTLKGVHNGRTMLSYIQEHIVCSWKQFESAWKSIWVLRYCKKYDVLFCFFESHLSVSQFSISETRPWPVKHCDEIVITGSGPSLRVSALPLYYIINRLPRCGRRWVRAANQLASSP